MRQGAQSISWMRRGSGFPGLPVTGGILRKVQLFAVPNVNLADLKIETTFDQAYRDATLKVRLQVANEGRQEAIGVICRLLGRTESLPAIPAGQSISHIVEVTVPNAPQWVMRWCWRFTTPRSRAWTTSSAQERAGGGCPWARVNGSSMARDI